MQNMKLCNACLTVRIGNKSIEVIQNPTSIEMRQLVKEFRRNLITFNFPPATMAARWSVDLNGNKYIWESHRATHEMMAPVLGRLVGVVIIDERKKESENESQTPSKLIN